MSLRDLNEGRGKKRWLSMLHKGHFSKLGKEKLHVKPRQSGAPGQEAPSRDRARLYGGKNRGGKIDTITGGKTNLVVVVVLAAVIIGLLLLLTGFGSSPSPPSPPPAPQANTTANQTANQTVEKPKLPDLDITDVKVDAILLTGNAAPITAKVKNSGDADAANVSIRFSMGQAILGKANISRIRAGASEEALITWTATDAFIGKYQLKATADPDSKIAEGNETNNEGTADTEIQKNKLIDVSVNFTKRSTEDFNKHWYSDRFRVPPKSGDNYHYFSITKTDAHKYRLDVAVSGFKLTMLNDIAQIQVQDASDAGWTNQKCIRKTVDSDLCIWNGPELTLTIQFKGSRLIVNDTSGQSSVATTTDKKLTGVELLALKYADWPGTLKTYKVSGIGAEPDALIPEKFFEFKNNIIYVHPLRWNPKTLDAEAGLLYSLEITTG